MNALAEPPDTPLNQNAVCVHSGYVTFGQFDNRGKLRWSESIHCHRCGLRREVDGIGFPPPQIRSQLLQSDGEWTLRLSQVNSAFNAVKVLRSALALDLKTAHTLLKHDSKIIFLGTKTECSWLQQLLRRTGEDAVLSGPHANGAGKPLPDILPLTSAPAIVEP